ncbi:MAG: TVP38/TMEM64 family protein, partial [Hyphomicrobiales bacterium]|nr:TVP38/TMEM64 family protein [Hyphomicrobiales bacterium]
DERDVAAATAQSGSLIAAIDTLTRNGHSLARLDLEDAKHARLPLLEDFGDPERPIAAPDFAKSFVGERPPARRMRRFVRIIGLGIAVVLLMLVWRITPVAQLTKPDTIQAWFATIAAMPAAPLIVPALFVLAGLLVFPVTVLIVATAAAFGPWLGFAYAAIGAIASAVVTYGIGVAVGQKALDNALGPRLNRIRRRIASQGVLAVALVRMVPIAPFTVINLAAGASRIPFVDYVIGTALGMLPGLVLMSALGYQIFNVLTAPTPLNVGLFVLAVLAWIGVSLAIQSLVTRRRNSGS